MNHYMVLDHGTLVHWGTEKAHAVAALRSRRAAYKPEYRLKVRLFESAEMRDALSE